MNMTQDQVNEFLTAVNEGKIEFSSPMEKRIAKEFQDASARLKELDAKLQKSLAESNALRESISKTFGSIESTANMLIENETVRRAEKPTSQPGPQSRPQ